jgi:membrane fusion protein, multidrug efflux system
LSVAEVEITPRAPSRVIPIVIIGGVVVTLAVTVALVLRAESKVNKVALASEPRPVTVLAARDATFRDSRKYVGTLRPWIEANVGPQFLSVYVNTVLVRPGAVVKRGDVLATLDCRNASAEIHAVEAEARAIDAMQKATADESARLNSLTDAGFVAIQEAETKAAQSASQEAELASERAKLASKALDVNDCIMRAPFDGDVATRTIDPGAFVRPGTAIVSVVDRSTVRMTVDVPESDFDSVAVGSPVTIHVVATGKDLKAAISRRAPSADPDTRTVHVEVDIPDPSREIPVNTTGELSIEVGQPKRATAVPIYVASITGAKASVYVVEDGVAHQKRFRVEGERGSEVYLDPALKPGTLVVSEGQFALSEAEKVAAKQVPYESASNERAPGGQEAKP